MTMCAKLEPSISFIFVFSRNIKHIQLSIFLFSFCSISQSISISHNQPTISCMFQFILHPIHLISHTKQQKRLNRSFTDISLQPHPPSLNQVNMEIDRAIRECDDRRLQTKYKQCYLCYSESLGFVFDGTK
ncbi:uncharacterized protein LOC130727558 [Lotus japonicus]|uniref:uncharacterized protein LOC130727558 n=1 Tax=Lotus japonicus TaxID=34305 RepID=UPI00258394E9|nr:uncharacterized protein LOC130727558 [Lotus japonicus]